MTCHCSNEGLDAVCLDIGYRMVRNSWNHLSRSLKVIAWF